MKKFYTRAVQFLVVGVIFLSGCKKGVSSAKPVDVPDDFCENVKITECDFVCDAQLKCGGEDLWECTFSSPETIEGMVVAHSGGEWIISDKGLNYTLDEVNMPEYSMVRLVTGCLDDIIAKRDLTCTESEGIITEKGVISGQDFSARFEGEKLCEIKIAKDIIAEF